MGQFKVAKFLTRKTGQNIFSSSTKYCTFDLSKLKAKILALIRQCHEAKHFCVVSCLKVVGVFRRGLAQSSLNAQWTKVLFKQSVRQSVSQPWLIDLLYLFLQERVNIPAAKFIVPDLGG
jgi:hypothetical protein